MVDLWSNLTDDRLWQWWPGGYLDGFHNKSGFLDSTPLA